MQSPTKSLPKKTCKFSGNISDSKKEIRYWKVFIEKLRMAHHREKL